MFAFSNNSPSGEEFDTMVCQTPSKWINIDGPDPLFSNTHTKEHIEKFGSKTELLRSAQKQNS